MQLLDNKKYVFFASLKAAFTCGFKNTIMVTHSIFIDTHTHTQRECAVSRDTKLSVMKAYGNTKVSENRNHHFSSRNCQDVSSIFT